MTVTFGQAVQCSCIWLLHFEAMSLRVIHVHSALTAYVVAREVDVSYFIVDDVVCVCVCVCAIGCGGGSGEAFPLHLSFSSPRRPEVWNPL